MPYKHREALPDSVKHVLPPQKMSDAATNHVKRSRTRSSGQR